MESQHDLVQQQFSGKAAAYAKSGTHNDADAIAEIVRLLDPKPIDDALDVATGPGTIALALAPRVRRVVALDITQDMLDETARRAREAGYANVETVRSEAEKLPFADESFDIVAVRTAPHHYSEIRRAVAEMARVVRRSGRVLIVDTSSPEDPELDRELNAIEKLRDPSHVRNYTPSEWRQMLSEAGLKVEHESIHTHALGKRLFYQEWIDRMQVAAADRPTLRNMFAEASPGLKEVMQIEPVGDDFSFTLPEITILARRA